MAWPKRIWREQERFTAVLEIPPVKSALDAVSIVADAEKNDYKPSD